MTTSEGKRTFRMFLTVAALTTLLGMSATNGQDARTKLPPGKWTLTVSPSSGANRAAVAVDVYSVVTERDKGLAVSKVTLWNKDSRDVVAVKLHWSLSEAGAPERILLEGDTATIGTWIPAGKARAIGYPVVSFAKVYKSLLKDGTLAGNYQIEVAVSEVEYAAEASSAPGRVRVVKAAYRRGAAAVMPGCANQGCLYDATPEADTFKCSVEKRGFFCSVSNQGRSCTETRCEGTPPVLVE